MNVLDRLIIIAALAIATVYATVLLNSVALGALLVFVVVYILLRWIL